MTPSEIITQEAQSKNADPTPVLQNLLEQINSGHVIMMQENDSLLFITRLGDKRAMVHLSTVDSPLTLRKSLAGFLKKLKDSEIDIIFGDTKNEQLLKLMKRVGFDVKKSNVPKFTWMAKV